MDLAGTIKLTNYRDKAVDIEVTRHVLGNVTGADNGGVVTKVNVFEDGSSRRAIRRAGGAGIQWPNWWRHFNGVGRIDLEGQARAGEDRRPRLHVALLLEVGLGLS